MAAAGPDPPWPPLLKGGKVGKQASEIVMAAAGPDPPWPPLLKGGKVANFAAAQRDCDGGRRAGPPLAPPSKGGEACATTLRPGNLRSLQCNVSTAQPETRAERWAISFP